MKKFGLLVVLGIWCTSVMAQYDEKALTILDAMSDKYSKIEAYSASIKRSLINEIDRVNEEMTGEITIKGNMFRLKIDDIEIFNDGKTVWTYVPAVSEVEIADYDPDEEEITPAKVLSMYKSGYKYLHLEETTENGVLCDVIDLIPEKPGDNNFFKIRMNVSQKDLTLQSWVMFEKNGNKYKVQITNFQPKISIDDNYFRFDASKFPGVEIEIVDLR